MPDSSSPSSPPSSPLRRIKVLVVDDQPLIRRGMSMILAVETDIDVVGQAGDGVEALELAHQLKPDVVLMDLHMPRMGGVLATREITAALPQTRVMVLTTFDTDQLVFDAVRAGACAYLLKDASETEVLETIRAIDRGESRLTSHIASKVLDQFRMLANSQPALAGSAAAAVVAVPEAVAEAAAAAPLAAVPAGHTHGLSDKEARVLELIAQGMSNKQIANTVFLAEGTVKNYVSRIMDKLHANTRTELAIISLRQKNDSAA